MLTLALAVLVGGAACSGDDDEAATSTTAAAAPDDTGSTTTTERSTTTTAPTADGCDAAPPEGDADPVDTIRGDLDGDGSVDEVLVTSGADGHWYADVALGGDRGTVTEELPTVESDRASAATARDLDGDGDDELFVIVANGAAAQIYGIYDLDGCDLEPVTLDGRPTELAVGGSVVELHGLRCDDDGGLTVLTATSDDGEHYQATARSYGLAGGILTETRMTGALPLTPASPEFPDHAQFAC